MTPPEPTNAASAWSLSENGEKALSRLGLSAHDQLFIRSHVAVFRSLPKGLPSRKLAQIQKRLQVVVKDLEELASSHDGVKLAPPGGRFPELTKAIEACRTVEQLLATYRGRRRSSTPWEVPWLATLCAFVELRTGRPQDSEVADIWMELDQSDESRTPDAVRTFRRRHGAMVEMARPNLPE